MTSRKQEKRRNRRRNNIDVVKKFICNSYFFVFVFAFLNNIIPQIKMQSYRNIHSVSHRDHHPEALLERSPLVDSLAFSRARRRSRRGL